MHQPCAVKDEALKLPAGLLRQADKQIKAIEASVGVPLESEAGPELKNSGLRGRFVFPEIGIVQVQIQSG